MFLFRADPDADGVGVAFSDAVGPDDRPLTVGGAAGGPARGPGADLLEDALGIRLAVVRQVHGVVVASPDDTSLAELALREADALVSGRSGIGLAVRVADCVPVLFADPERRLIGAAHAGRVGLAAGVLQRTHAELVRRGARRITAWIGPHICGRCYEVPARMAEDVARVVPGVGSQTRWGTPALDLGAGAEAVLAALGVEVRRVPGCTFERADLHSYRRDAAAAGRQAGIIWLAA